MVTGSAPASPAILLFFSKVIGATVLEGYGQTETVAASFLTAKGDLDYGHVGGPNRVTEFKLVDVP
jgi:long-chain acyl-CoA synthetase